MFIFSIMTTYQGSQFTFSHVFGTLFFTHTQEAEDFGPVSQPAVHGTCSPPQSFATALPGVQLHPVHPSWQSEPPAARPPVTAPLSQPATGAGAAREGFPWSLQNFEGAPFGQQQVGEGSTKHPLLQEPASAAAGSQSYQVSVSKVTAVRDIKSLQLE